MSLPQPTPAPGPYPALPPPVQIPLVVVPRHPCPYLPGQIAQTRAFATASLPPELYHDFMDAAFRRSGRVFYQPACPNCRACVPIRIPVDRFKLSKSQRRCRRRNQDLTAHVSAPRSTDEKFELYCRYVKARHHPAKEEDREAFDSFLYESPVETIEICHRNPAGRLLAVGICDVCTLSLSSVYFYFDPDESRRGLAPFGSLFEIDLAREMGISQYYLGYWVAGCRAMEYKTSLRPCQVLGIDGVWRDYPALDGAAS